MITAAKTTRVLAITAINYDYYQNPVNYVYANEDCKNTARIQQTYSTINNNDNNEKNDKNNNKNSLTRRKRERNRWLLFSSL